MIRETQPGEIYNLSAQSSVGLSFTQPVETLDSIIFGTVNLLEAMRFLGADIRYYSASSSECFGVTPDSGAVETTAFAPGSPYSIAKASAHWIVANYREAYGLHACSGLLFNHESPLRPALCDAENCTQRGCDRAAPRRKTLARQSRHRARLGLDARIRRGDVVDAAAIGARRYRDCHRQARDLARIHRALSRGSGSIGRNTSRSTRRCCVRSISPSVVAMRAGRASALAGWRRSPGTASSTV